MALDPQTCPPGAPLPLQVNLDEVGSKRQEVLSTGRYSLIDVACRGCSAVLVSARLWIWTSAAPVAAVVC